jgi:hypothetical protein
MTAEAKLRYLAAKDSTLQAFFGTNPFRWFHIQLPPGYVMQPTGKTCARVRQVSTSPLYSQSARVALSQVRFQLEILDPDATVVDNAMKAVVSWLDGVCLTSDAEFTSPATTPRQYPTFIVNQFPTVEPAFKPPVPGQLIDFRCWNID